MPDGQGFYYFNHGLSCLFEMPTSDARSLLPSHLEPLEVQHERSILSVTAFDFYKGDAGEYEELVLSILVPPLIKSGDPLPKAALYPFSVATSTSFGRQQGIDRWKLPHLMEDIEVELTEGDSKISVSVGSGGKPILDLTCTSHNFEATELLFHSFMSDQDDNFKANITLQGEGYSEHEFEQGSLKLYQHEMTEGLTIDEVSEYPFREQWMKKGVEMFSPLEKI